MWLLLVVPDDVAVVDIGAFVSVVVDVVVVL